jgi:glycosyltransferase involved in cell wall biosynthesis
MGFADNYIKENRGEFFFEPAEFVPFRMIVVIPCFNEPEIKYALSSLFDCEYPEVETGIVVVVNSTEKSPEKVLIQNRETISELNALSLQLKSFPLLFVIGVENLPEKNGGVGWARKIGMDWAVSHFNHFGVEEGVIVSLDADTLVEKNYLKSIYTYFLNHPGNVAATINFEHQLHPCDLRTESLEKASVFYELFMRYYRNALSITGFPNSIYTVGSCFAVKAGAYVFQGGMNRKKAGEDFYFLHKMAMLGEIGEIISTTVYPSSRLSDRVPFGTGPSLQKYFEGTRSIEYTYPLEAFEVLKFFFSNMERFYYKADNLQSEDFSEDASFIGFSNESKLPDEIRELIANCGSPEIFKKRFFHLFNAFKVLKWLNYAQQHCFPQKALLNESRKLLKLMGIEENKIPTDPALMLNLFRLLDRTRTND